MTMDQALFYGGTALAIVALLLFLVYWVVHLIRGKTLEARLDAEYGRPRP